MKRRRPLPVNKRQLSAYVSIDCFNGVEKIAQELGVTITNIVERLIIDAGLAKRFYQPNRWGEIIETPATVAVHVPDSIQHKKQILLAKYEKELTFTAIKDMNRHIADLDKFIAEKVQEIGKSELLEAKETRGLLPQKVKYEGLLGGEKPTLFVCDDLEKGDLE